MAEGCRRKRKVAVLGGAMYALFVGFGFQAARLEPCSPVRALGVAAALCLPFAWVLARLFGLPQGRRALREEGDFHPVRAFLLMLACYVPMLLISFPGAFAYDVPFQLEQFFTGRYSTHHPLLHTLLLGGCVGLGRALGSVNLGAALYSVVQMAALAACFALTLQSVARQAGARAARWGCLFFALYPLHMAMSVNATKDVLFSGLFVLTLALVREALVGRDWSVGLGVRIVLAGAGMMLLRNNALYAVAVWVVLLMLICRRRALAVAGAAVLAAALCVGVNGAMKAMTGAREGDLCEMLSWPIQQMARVRNLHADTLTPQEKRAIDELMPGESWRLYDPTLSDPVKFEFDTQRLLSDPLRYAQVYLSLVRRFPGTCLDALLQHTVAFWYPYDTYRVSGYYLQMGVTDQYYDWCDFERITSQSVFPRVLAALSWRFGAQGSMQIPGIGWLFNMGLIVWVMLYFVLRDIYHGRWAVCCAGLLPVLLWGTFLLGPVMAGRYIYPFVCCLPVLVCGTDRRMPGGV